MSTIGNIPLTASAFALANSAQSAANAASLPQPTPQQTLTDTTNAVTPPPTTNPLDNSPATAGSDSAGIYTAVANVNASTIRGSNVNLSA